MFAVRSFAEGARVWVYIPRTLLIWSQKSELLSQEKCLSYSLSDYFEWNSWYNGHMCVCTVHVHFFNCSSKTPYWRKKKWKFSNLNPCPFSHKCSNIFIPCCFQKYRQLYNIQHVNSVLLALSVVSINGFNVIIYFQEVNLRNFHYAHCRMQRPNIQLTLISYKQLYDYSYFSCTTK